MKQKVLKKRGAWTFSGKLPDVFYSHIKKSVPLYEEGHKIILQTSDFFLKDN